MHVGANYPPLILHQRERIRFERCLLPVSGGFQTQGTVTSIPCPRLPPSRAQSPQKWGPEMPEELTHTQLEQGGLASLWGQALALQTVPSDPKLAGSVGK